jgi:hypothetical protein
VLLVDVVGVWWQEGSLECPWLSFLKFRVAVVSGLAVHFNSKLINN